MYRKPSRITVFQLISRTQGDCRKHLARDCTDTVGQGAIDTAYDVILQVDHTDQITAFHTPS